VSIGEEMPREFSVAACATRIFEAATIFMADVIFAMFCTDRMRSLTAPQHTPQRRWAPLKFAALRCVVSGL